MVMAMASAATTLFNRKVFQNQTFALPLTSTRHAAAGGISLRHFNKHLTCTLKLSSSHSISASELQPFVLNRRISIFNSPRLQSGPSSRTVFAAKGYKMKTHKALAKRFGVTGQGKIMRRRAGKQHLLAKKNTKRKLRLSKMVLNKIWNRCTTLTC